MRSRQQQRIPRQINGAEHWRCTSCDAWYPLRAFYMQKRADGTPRPHSWCRTCYLTNSGRGEGMRVRAAMPASPQVAAADHAASQFLRIRAPRAAVSLAPLVRAVLA